MTTTSTRCRVAVVGVANPIETFIGQLLSGLPPLGIDVDVVGPNDVSLPGIGWVPARRPGRVRVRDARTLLATGRDLATGRLHRSTHRADGPHRALLQAISRTRPDVIYAPWTATAVHVPGLFELDVPVVLSCRGSQVNIAPWNPARSELRHGLRPAFAASTFVHCVSDAMVAEATGFGLDPVRARVIRPAVDPDRFGAAVRARTGGGPRPIRLLSVGTVNWRKAHRYTIEALRVLVDEGIDVELRIAGQLVEAEPIRHLIQDLGLEARVRLLGRRTPAEILTELRAADVFVSSSLSEGIANGMLEAMATGLPAVVTDVGGTREAVEHGRTGLLVPVRDPEALAEAIRRLADDPKRRLAIGLAASRHVRKCFHLDDQRHAFADLFLEAAACA